MFQSPGKNRLLVTRDSPNVIIPTSSPTSPTAGTAWAWGAYSQVTAGLAYPFLLEQILAMLQVGFTLTADGTYAYPTIAHYEVATGAAGSEAPKVTAPMGVAAYIVTSGFSGAASVTAISASIRDLPVGPVLIPASTRIAVRAALETVPSSFATRMFLSGYNLTAPPNFVKVPGLDDLYLVGSRPLTTYPLVTLGTTTIVSGLTGVFGAYVPVLASFTDDTLVIGMASQPSSAALSSNSTFDISLGAAGSEAIQARSAFGAGTAYSTGLEFFAYPFIAYKGEQLSARVFCNASTKSHLISVYGIQLS